MFLSIGMLKQKYFLTDIFILSAEKQPIKLSWRKIECLRLSLPIQPYTKSCFLFNKGYLMNVKWYWKAWMAILWLKRTGNY